VGSVHVPNYKSFLVTEVERKKVRRRARFQQHGDDSCYQVFSPPARQGVEGNTRHSVRNIRVRCTIVCHCQKLGGPVWTCFFPPTCDASHPGRPKTVITPEIIDQIHELILEDHQISAKSIAEKLGISLKRVGSIIHEDLDMRKLSAKWVPKCLNADQKRQRCQSSEQLLEFFSARSKWFHIAIGDHERNLVIRVSLWPRDKATINGVAA